MSCVDSDWGGLEWGEWEQFDQSRLGHLPTSPGLYRVRPDGHPFLMYVGQTGRSLRERVLGLRRNTRLSVMPYNDPHTAAPSLWAWADAEHYRYEVSAASVGLAERERKACECFLLWSYRLERRESTICNHGRFHPRYVKSRGRRSGFRGHRLQERDPDNPAGGASMPPLASGESEPDSLHWMGLTWSTLSVLETAGSVQPTIQGLYRLVDLD
ncbi:MAG: GIY-YIG nuclease family protein [Candidatus Latescibacterota bacterium]|nr:GIY-YIG nuclease family protein [Candidatus Latescibacterota bacterium]